MHNHNNPYESLATEDAKGQVDLRTLGGSWRYYAWPVVYVLNLIVPILFAGRLTMLAWVGSVSAIGLYFVLGLAICKLLPKTATELIVGSLLIAMTQFFPILQVIAGAIGLGVTDAFGLEVLTSETVSVDTVAAGFVATLVTGAILLIAAYLAGVFIMLICDLFRARSQSRA